MRKKRKAAIEKPFYLCVAVLGTIILTMLFSCRTVDDFCKIVDLLPVLVAAGIVAMKCFIDRNKDGVPDFLEKEEEKEDKEHE